MKKFKWRGVVQGGTSINRTTVASTKTLNSKGVNDGSLQHRRTTCAWRRPLRDP